LQAAKLHRYKLYEEAAQIYHMILAKDPKHGMFLILLQAQLGGGSTILYEHFMSLFCMALTSMLQHRHVGPAGYKCRGLTPPSGGLVAGYAWPGEV